MKKKTVLLINDKLYGGGAETVFRENIKILSADEEINVYYASTDNCNNVRHYILDDSKRGLFGPIKYTHNFKNYNKMKTILSEIKPDVVHIHNFYGHISPSIIKPIREYKISNRIKVVQTLHDYSLVCPNSSLYNYNKNEHCTLCVGKKYKIAILKERCYHGNFVISLLKFLRTFNALNIQGHKDLIDSFICPSNFLKEIILREGVREEKIHVVPNPISINEEFIKQIKNPEFFAKKKNHILYVGRLSYEKGVHELILSWRQVYSVCKDWKLLIIGEGGMREYLQDLAKGIYNIEFLGWLNRDEVFENMKKAKVLILPSVCFENQSTVVIEAMLNGVIPIVRDIGGMKELATKYKVVKTFRNKEDLLATIKKICIEGIELKDEEFLSDIYSLDCVESYVENIKKIYFG